MVRVALAVMHMFCDELMGIRFEGMMSLLKRVPRSLNPDELIEATGAITFGEDDWQKLMSEFYG